MNSVTIDSPVGKLTLSEEGGVLKSLCFGAGENAGEVSPLLKKAEAQLAEYFRGERKEFDLPVSPEGTEFQQRVWRALCEIPYGQTRCYADIAAAVGSPRGFRAVGMANNRNRVSIIIPCHRVIGADGSMTGYGGGIEKKLFLLELERKFK